MHSDPATSAARPGSAPPRWWWFALDAVTHGVLAGGCAWLALWAVQAFWAVPMPRAWWRAAGAIWGVAFALETLVMPRARHGLGVALLRTALACGGAVAGFVLWVKNYPVADLHGVPWGRAAVLLFAGLAVMRVLREHAARLGLPVAGENLRLALLGATIPVATWPYFSAHFVGGVDALWYAQTLIDYLQQVRAGVFPVLAGQGEYAFNGAVHPFRSAPYFHNLGGLIDWVTGRTLGGLAVQHLSVVATMTAAAFVAYGCLVRLVPQRRWTACLVAAAYALSPALLALITDNEMYMSYMASAWLPVLFYGVARALERRDWPAHVALAVSLAILWTCHSPVALWATIAALVMLGAAIVARGNPWPDIFRLGLALALCAWLAFYYFYSVNEFAPFAGPSVGPSIWALPLVALAVAAAGWWSAGRTRLALATLATASVALGFASRPLLGAVLAGGGVFVAGWRWHGSGLPEGEDKAGVVCGWLLVAGGAALASMGALGVWLKWPVLPAVSDQMPFLKSFWPGVFVPLKSNFQDSDVQPGYAVWLLGLWLLAGAALTRSVTMRAWAVVTALFVLLLPLTPLTQQLWGQLPLAVLVATSGAWNLRLSPAWVALMCFGGFYALGWLAARRPRWHVVALVLLALLIGWTGWQLQWLNRRVHGLEYPPGQTSDKLRTENAVLTIYSYNFLDLPPYFSHGVVDYHLESRLIDPASREPRPELARRAAAPAGPAERRTLIARPDSGGAGWADLNASVTLQPGERKLLHFTFHVAEPGGLLVIHGPRNYRQYHLPSSGRERSFGAGPDNSRDLPLWNTLDQPVEVSLLWGPSRPLPAEGLAFADMEVRSYSVDALPVHTLSLIPYRARLEVITAAVLETPRRYIEGYVATVDGQPAQVIRTATGQVGVPVPPGAHEVEVRYAGTAGLWRAFRISAAGWILVAGWMLWKTLGFWRARRSPRPA